MYMYIHVGASPKNVYGKYEEKRGEREGVTGEREREERGRERDWGERERGERKRRERKRGKRLSPLRAS